MGISDWHEGSSEKPHSIYKMSGVQREMNMSQISDTESESFFRDCM